MIAGAHVLLFAHDADAARAFIRDVLGLEGVDAGGGWLIFRLPPAEAAVHPAAAGPGEARTELSLMCADVEATRRELEAKGVVFTAPVTDQGWGLETRLEVPGFGALGLYEPRHPTLLAGLG